MLEPIIIGLISIFALLALMLVGVHMAIAFMIVSFIGLVTVINLDATLPLIVNCLFALQSSYMFIVLPLFVLLGYCAEASGLVEKGFAFAHRWLGHLPAGMYLSTILSCAVFAGASGSSAATAVAVGKITLPEMKRYGYDQKLSIGCVASSGTLGVLIPPSVVLVVYGVVTGASIGRLLLAGFLPGIVSAAIYMLGLSVLVRFRPKLAPPAARYSWKERFQSVSGIWGVVLILGTIIVGIYAGIFTPTEAASVGALVAIGILAYAKRREFFGLFKKAILDTIPPFVMISFIILSSTVFTRFLTVCGATDAFLGFIFEGGFSPYVVLGLFLLLMIILGMFLSATAGLILIAPLAYKTFCAFGFNGIWLGIIMVKLFEIAVITPPVGLNVFAIKSIVPDIMIEDCFYGCIPFLIMDLLTVGILIAFPQISLWLPTQAFG